MKILRIIARLNVGGPARHVVWLTEGLQGAEYQSVLVTGIVPPGEDDMSYFAGSMGVRPIVIPEMSREISPTDLISVWKIYRLLVRLRPDLVHTHTAKAGTVGRLAGLLNRVLTPTVLVGYRRRPRFVHTYHGHVFHSYYGPGRTRIFLAIEKLLSRFATDRIVVLSDQQFVEIHRKFGIGHADQFVVIPLGFDTAAFANWRQRRPLMREELSAGSNDILVGIVGRLTEIKNHQLFLQMAAQYQSFPPSEGHSRRVRFVIIGDGHLRRALEQQVQHLGLSGEVEFLGTRDDPENFYPALDVVALTSLNEGTPLTVLEAMANARPVIATAVGGVSGLLGPGALIEGDSDAGYQVCERGILVGSGDTLGFARGLSRLIEDEELRRDIGNRGRGFVEAHYSKERLLKDVASLYRELVQEPHSAVTTVKSDSDNRTRQTRS
jgi:glycosyltransferase involved in cell wall biosynthesis